MCIFAAACAWDKWRTTCDSPCYRNRGNDHGSHYNVAPINDKSGDNHYDGGTIDYDHYR